MKKFLLLALPVLAAAVLIPTAFAGNGPANKMTADVSFDNGGLNAHWVFNAHDLGDSGDKGSVFYEDSSGGSYYADVVNVVFADANTATFSATVTSSTYVGVSPGTTYTWTVNDEGEPGIDDWFTYGGTVYPITAGNIKAHFNG